MTDLRLLVVEDSEDDATLLVRELRRAGHDVDFERVQTAAAMRDALRARSWDAIVSDYKMPGFSGEDALEILKEAGLDLPFILVSGTIGEEKAVALMKAGAHDYILKGNLLRLAPALDREIEQAAHRRARAAAEAEARKLSRAVEQSPVSVVITDLAGAIEYVNPQFTALTGYTPEEVRGKNPRILKSGTTPPEVYRELWETITSGRVWTGELQNRKKSGESFWERATISPVQDEAGLTTHFLAVKEDITDRKRADVEILRLNRLLRTISDVNQLIVHGVDRDALLAHACRILVEVGGFRMAWIGLVDPKTSRVVPAAHAGEGKEYLDGVMVRTDDTPEGRGPMGVAIRTGRHVVAADIAEDPASALWRDRQLAFGFRSAGAFPIAVRGAVVGGLKVYGGEPFAIGEEDIALLDELASDLGYAIGALDERNERLAAEEALAKREFYYRSLIENAQDVITIVDVAGTMSFQSPAAERITGRPAAEFLGKNVFDFIHPEDIGAVQESLRRAVESPEESRTAVFRFRHADGSWRTMEGIGKLFLGGGSTQFVVNSRDVTESRSVEEQLRQAQKMEAVGRLAGGVAHDFNNLLTVIGGYGELLASSLADDPERRESVDEIVKAAGRAAALTRQLLAFSRRQVLEMRVLDLRSVVDESEKMLRRLIGEDVELVVSRPETPAMVKADGGQIEQVLMNLAVNARDAMPEGGRLSIAIALEEIGAPFAFAVEVAPPGRYVALSVTDMGTGMDEETLAHLFEPFFTTKEKGKGTGLGLATVFGIVKQSGGFFDVRSAPGEGTTFRILLPEAEGVPRTKRASGVHRRSGTETILLVEDESGVRELTRVLLERNGYRVVAADGLDDALAKAGSFDGPIHLVLTDVIMPRGTGPELVNVLAPRRPEARILFMSGYTDDMLSRQQVAEGGVPILQKPFKEKELLRRVREALDAPTATPPVVA